MLILDILLLIQRIYLLVFSLIYLGHCLIHKIGSCKVIIGLRNSPFSTCWDSVFIYWSSSLNIVIQSVIWASFIWVGIILISEHVLVILHLMIGDNEIYFIIQILVFYKFSSYFIFCNLFFAIVGISYHYFIIYDILVLWGWVECFLLLKLCNYIILGLLMVHITILLR